MTNTKHKLATALNEDANWAACLYLTDELSVEESNLFEDQLAEREDLQLALIEATRQLACLSHSQALQQNELQSGSDRLSASLPRQTQWRLKAVAVIASLVVCVAVAVLTSHDKAAMEATDRDLISVAASSLVEAEVEVLQAWVNIQAEAVADEDDVMDTTSDLSVPDWMLTAVLLEAEDFDETDRALQPSKNSESI